jgi:HSP20 family protein
MMSAGTGPWLPDRRGLPALIVDPDQHGETQAAADSSFHDNQEESAMALPTRYNPLRQVSLLDPLVDLEDLFRGVGTRSMSRGYEKTLEMRMDVHEDDKAYRISIDVPGVKKEDIDVSVEGNQVTVTAEVKREQSSGKEEEVHSERFYGKAFRSFSLPNEVDSSKSQARYDGGVLSLTLPKKGDSQSRHLSIN